MEIFETQEKYFLSEVMEKISMNQVFKLVHLRPFVLAERGTEKLSAAALISH